MVPLGTLVGLASLGAFGWKEWQERKAKKAKELPAGARIAPRIEAASFENGPADIAIFTTLRGDVRHFDPPIKAGLPALLDMRSAQALQPAQLAETAEEARELARLGSFFLIVPISEYLPNAGETVREAEKAGAAVLGSLALPHLAIGLDVPMVIAIGGPELEASANLGGEFAVLVSARVEAAAEEEEAPAAEPEIISTAKFERVPGVKNGAGSAPAVVDIFGKPSGADAKEGA